jgi:hypothetical protein
MQNIVDIRTEASRRSAAANSSRSEQKPRGTSAEIVLFPGIFRIYHDDDAAVRRARARRDHLDLER